MQFGDLELILSGISSDVTKRSITYLVKSNYDKTLELLQAVDKHLFFKLSENDFHTGVDLVSGTEVCRCLFNEDVDLYFVMNWTKPYSVYLAMISDSGNVTKSDLVWEYGSRINIGNGKSKI